MCLIDNEISDSYSWILQNLKKFDNDNIQTILTDGDIGLTQ